MLEHISKKEYQKYLKVVDGFHRFVRFVFTSSYRSFVSTSTFTTSLGVVRIFPQRASHSQETKRVQVLNEETVFVIDLCPFLNLSVTDRFLGISIGGR
mgnify:FL=1